jgi:hypothetical protein
MYKIRLAYILVSILLLASCSVFKGPERVKRDDVSYRTERFLEEVGNKNITNQGFRFDRIRVVMDSGGETRRFTASIRYDQKGTMLVSVRIIASIEVARIYLDSERIVILDRLNKIYTTGNTSEVLKKYGMKWDMIPLLFGDLPNGFVSAQRIKCVNGTANLMLEKGDDNYSADFECSQGKLMNFSGSSGIFSASISFQDFIEEANSVYPQSIFFREAKSVISMELSMAGYSGYEGFNSVPERPSRYDNGRME